MYTCPMHPEIRQDAPGKCPKCGMDLVRDRVIANNVPTVVGIPTLRRDEFKRTVKDFLPLIVIIAVVFLLTALMLFRAGHWDAITAMRYFEGFFFLIFGIFKLLNWKGFAHAYATYDIIAKRSMLYAYAYPLIELALAAGYLFSFHVLRVAAITFVLMIVGSIGVAQELKKKNQIPCACLGVVFKIPMTWVTFVEDVVMAVMAGVMIGMILLF